MVSAFSVLFNFKFPTRALMPAIYIRDMTTRHPRCTFESCSASLKYLYLLQHAAFSEYWLFDVGHMMHLMHFTCGEPVSVLRGRGGSKCWMCCLWVKRVILSYLKVNPGFLYNDYTESFITLTRESCIHLLPKDGLKYCRATSTFLLPLAPHLI